MNFWSSDPSNLTSSWQPRHGSFCDVCFLSTSLEYLTADDLFEVMSELEPAKAQWYNMGVGLKVRKSDLEAIKMDSRNSLDGLREMLEIWLDQVSPRPSWQTVVRVLRSPVIEKQKNLADELDKKYVSKSPAVTKISAVVKGPGDEELSEFVEARQWWNLANVDILGTVPIHAE